MHGTTLCLGSDRSGRATPYVGGSWVEMKSIEFVDLAHISRPGPIAKKPIILAILVILAILAKKIKKNQCVKSTIK